MRNTPRIIFCLSLICTLGLLLCGCSGTKPNQLTLTAILERGPLIEDPVSERYLQSLMLRLSNAALIRRVMAGKDLPPPPPVKIIDSKDPSAITLPDGSLFLSRGLIISLSSEAELSFVLAHEYAHIQLKHIEDDLGSLSRSTRRDYELQADKRAVALVAAAGYDPRAAIMALGRVHGPSDPSYPDLSKRRERAEEWISSSGWLPPGTVNRREFLLLRRSVWR